MSDDDWDTDPDYKNDLTEVEKRAYGNRETMQKHQAATGGHGAAFGSESGALNAPAPPPPKMGEVLSGEIGVGLAPTPAAQYAAPTRVEYTQPAPRRSTPALVKESHTMAAASAAQPVRRPSKGSVFDRPKNLSDAEVEELRTVFSSFDADMSGHISSEELANAMEQLGSPVERSKLTALMGEADTNGDQHVNFDEFLNVVERTKAGDTSVKGFSDVIRKKSTVLQIKKDATVHSFAEEECMAFADFINTKLGADPHLAYLLPISEITELFSVVADGVLLCRLINLAEAEAIDERVINLNPRNKFHITENLNLAINAAKAIGLKVVNIGSGDIQEGRPHLVLGLVWQIVKMTLLANINLKANPNLIRLLLPGETLEAFLKLPAEKILLRWFNYHLAQAGAAKRIENFGKDLHDSEAYALLLKQIDPSRQCSTQILQQPDKLQRAAYVASNGARIGAEFKIAPADIVRANEKLNLGFCAALFNACPGLEPPDEQDLSLLAEMPDDDGGDSREERAFRMWINSLGIERYVHNLFDDVRDGMVILQVMDKIQPGVVDHSRVNVNPTMVFKQTENCNYAVDLAKDAFHFSLVGIQGNDIVVGNGKLALALFWQQMRYSLLAFLASLKSSVGGSGGAASDEDILRWAREKVASTGSTVTLRDLHDKSLSSGLFLVELLAAVEPRCVDRELLTPGMTEEEQKLNAKYAISSARKLGCTLFLLWEDIVEVRPKMILSFLATVMATAVAGGA